MLLYLLVVIPSIYSAHLSNEIIDCCKEYTYYYNSSNIKKFPNDEAFITKAKQSSINFHTLYQASDTNTHRTILGCLTGHIISTITGKYECITGEELLNNLRTQNVFGQLHTTIEESEKNALEVRNQQIVNYNSQEFLETIIEAENILLHSTNPLANLHRFIRETLPRDPSIKMLFAVRHVLESIAQNTPINPAVINYHTKVYYPDLPKEQVIDLALLDNIKKIINSKHYPIIELQKQKLLIALFMRMTLPTPNPKISFYFFATNPDYNCGYYTIGAQHKKSAKHKNLLLKKLIMNNLNDIDMQKLEEQFNNQKVDLRSNNPVSFYSHHKALKSKFAEFKKIVENKDSKALSNYIDNLYKCDNPYINKSWFFSYYRIGCFSHYRMKEFLASYFLDINISVYMKSAKDQKLYYIGPDYSDSQQKKIPVFTVFTNSGAVHDAILASPTDYPHIAYGLQYEKEYFFENIFSSNPTKDILTDSSAWMEKVEHYSKTWLGESDLAIEPIKQEAKAPVKNISTVKDIPVRHYGFFYYLNLPFQKSFYSTFFNTIKTPFKLIWHYFWGNGN